MPVYTVQFEVEAPEELDMAIILDEVIAVLEQVEDNVSCHHDDVCVGCDDGAVFVVEKEEYEFDAEEPEPEPEP